MDLHERVHNALSTATGGINQHSFHHNPIQLEEWRTSFLTKASTCTSRSFKEPELSMTTSA
jgi:hypothetical protein